MKTIKLILATAAILALTACSKAKSEPTTTSELTASPDTTTK